MPLICDSPLVQSWKNEINTTTSVYHSCCCVVCWNHIGPVTSLCQRKCWFKPPFVQKRQGCCTPVLSVCFVDCKSRWCIQNLPFQLTVVFAKYAARSVQPCWFWRMFQQWRYLSNSFHHSSMPWPYFGARFSDSHLNNIGLLSVGRNGFRFEMAMTMHKRASDRRTRNKICAFGRPEETQRK